MWSELFTHDFENGEKIAIILLDTQGVFDTRSTMKDNTVTFALSMMLSSVQCFNVMRNIQEDNLNNLQQFSEYARAVQQRTNEKPFQYLLFLVRDWRFGYETNGYGWNGQTINDEIMNQTEDLSDELRQLRERIQSSFDEIGAFLLPFPGKIVAEGRNFKGDLKQIDADFVFHVKELMPALLAPENLILKKVNGGNVRAKDLVQYLQTYINIFNSDTLPSVTTLLEVCSI